MRACLRSWLPILNLNARANFAWLVPRYGHFYAFADEPSGLRSAAIPGRAERMPRGAAAISANL